MDAGSPAGVGDLLRRGQQVHERLWAEEAGPHLTSVQYGLLLTVGRWPERSQQRISDEMSVDKSTAGDVLHRLADRGLVELARDPADARRHVVVLSPEGRSTVVDASPAVRRVGERLLENLSFDDGERLLRLLRDVAYEGSAPDPGTPPPPFPGWPLRLPELRLDTALGHLVRRAQRVHGARWREVAGTEITPVQFDAMTVLADLARDGAGADQGEWADRSSLDPATATSLLTRLKRNGLVEHSPHEADRRRKRLRLTGDGGRALDQARGLSDAAAERVLRPLAAGDRTAFVALFRDVCDRRPDSHGGVGSIRSAYS